jgi:tryptophan-rich hypothetical protein
MKTKSESVRNRINPEKLPLSKWTAVVPKQKEKHFIVTEVIRDENLNVTACLLEAVLTKNSYTIDWHMLADRQAWRAGWH